MSNRECPARFVCTEPAPQWQGLRKSYTPDDRQRGLVVTVNTGVNGAYPQELRAVRQQCGEHFTRIALTPMRAPDVVADFYLGGLRVVEMMPAGADELAVASRNQGKPLEAHGLLLVMGHNASRLLECTGGLACKATHFRVGKLAIDDANICTHEWTSVESRCQKHCV